MKRICIILLSLFIALSVFVLPVNNDLVSALENKISVSEEKLAAGLTRIKIVKNAEGRTKTSQDVNLEKDLIEKYQINPELFAKSNGVIIQSEEFVAPTESYIETSDGRTIQIETLINTDGGNTVGIWENNILTIYTFAYDLGTYQGGRLYEIESRVCWKTVMSYRNVDEVVVHHSSGAVYMYSGSGEQAYHHYREYNGIVTHNEHIWKTLPVYFTQGFAINYRFDFPSDINSSGTGGGVSISLKEFHTNWEVRGGYTILVSSATNVQTCYFYNKKIFGGNLSLSFTVGPVGIGINVSGAHESYIAEPIILFVKLTYC